MFLFLNLAKSESALSTLYGVNVTKAAIGAYIDSVDLCRYFDIYHMYLVAFDICHLLSGVGVNIATDILCESDSCHCKLPISR